VISAEERERIRVDAERKMDEAIAAGVIDPVTPDLLARIARRITASREAQ
jgi:hypothetical protein